jgi:sugar-specific transcriptional regulator TrmB
MNPKELQELGFSEGEAEIYLALLRAGRASIAQLSQKSGRHRTHIYDTVEKLKKKGLIAESVTDNKKFLIPSSPENILNYLREKEERAVRIVDELQVLQKEEKEIKVETFSGIFGLKSVLRDILKEKKDYVGYGEGTRFEKILPEFYEQFRGQAEALSIGLKLIVRKGTKIPERKKLEVRHLDFVSPSTTFIYANKILIIIWEPFPTAIRITDKQTAESYLNYFNLLWRMAKN